MMRASDIEENSSARAEYSVISKTAIRSIGKCQIVAELGHGGMANVYLAVTQSEGRVNKLVVLKALRQELASEPEALSMFLDEARVAVQLNHPNVVQTYEVGNHGGRQVIVMEYLDGQSLSRIMRECETQCKALPLHMSLRIMINVLEGLHYTHELKSYHGKPLELVHRDISPQNVFVTYEGQVKLLDFGIAKAASSSTHTAAGVVKGKFGYMAPEQMVGDAVDRRADIYSVGCMLWTFAAGQKLWGGKADGKILKRVLAGDVPSPLSANPSCDPELARIVEKSMAHDRENRYPTALDLQADLEKYCESLGPQIKQKEIGRLVSDLFAESRAQIGSLIEAQLTLLASHEADVSPVQLSDEYSRSVSQQQSISISQQQSVSVSQQQLLTGEQTALAPPARSGRKWPLFVAGACALGALAVWSSHRGTVAPDPHAAPTHAAPSEAKPSTPTAEKAAEPAIQNAMVTFRVNPQDAELALDGAALPAGTRSRVFPADGARHVLQAQADGYEPATLEFVVTNDMTLELALIRSPQERSHTRFRVAPAPKASAAPAAASAAAPPPPPVSTQKAAPDCSDPFFLDAAGIKRVRNECR